MVTGTLKTASGEILGNKYVYLDSTKAGAEWGLSSLFGMKKRVQLVMTPSIVHPLLLLKGYRSGLMVRISMATEPAK